MTVAEEALGVLEEMLDEFEGLLDDAIEFAEELWDEVDDLLGKACLGTGCAPRLDWLVAGGPG